MGCFPLRFLSGCSTGSSKIKILTVEGQCYKYDPPMIVKEVLTDFPSHVLFHFETVQKLGTPARPLLRSLSLVPGQLYFLVPQAETRASQPPQQHSSVNESVSLEQQATHSSSKRKVSFAPTQSSPAPASMDTFTSTESVSTTASVQILPSPSSGVVRLKMVVSKRHLMSILEECADSATLFEGLLSPLLKETEVQSLSSLPSSDDIISSEWRPSLESIPESP